MPKIASGNARINLLFPPRLLEQIKRLATRRGTTMTALIVQFCTEQLLVEIEKEKTLQQHK
jgi:hypothetical protein